MCIEVSKLAYRHVQTYHILFNFIDYQNQLNKTFSTQITNNYNIVHASVCYLRELGCPVLL